jgi:hypothetical protein
MIASAAVVDDVGYLAWRALRTGGRRWAVGPTFDRAVYIKDGHHVVVLTAADVPNGPLHVRTECDRLDVRTGEIAIVEPPLIWIGTTCVDMSGSIPWRGALPSSDALNRNRGRGASAMKELSRASALSSGLFGIDTTELEACRTVTDLAHRLIGLGPGFTPAGDDVMAGILMALAGRDALCCAEPAAHLRGQSRSHPYSLAFVEAASRGQAIAPVHDLLVALASSDDEGFQGALSSLERVGATSGADVALGLCIGLELDAVLCAPTHPVSKHRRMCVQTTNR